MTLFFVWLFLFGVIFACAYHRLSLWYWVPSLGVLLFLYGFFGLLGITTLSILFSVWAVVSVFVLVAPLRLRLITLPFMQWFRQQQPPLSQAEQDVLSAGGLWWEEAFFTGRPDWETLFELPKPKLTDEEKKFLENETDELCASIDDWEIVHKRHDLSPETWDIIKRKGFWALIIDKQYGGLGFSASAHSAIVSKIASRSVSVAVSVMVPNSLGPAEFLQAYGTDEQKNYYLPRLAKGEETPCFALTAPTAGSDAASIIDSGVVCKGKHDGKEVIGIRLNFDKRYITLAPVATLIGLAFKLTDPEKLLGDKENIGITLALIPAKHKGIEIGARHHPLNLAFMNGPIRGKDVFIPIDWVIGGRERCGQGWKMMLECLAVGRGISLPALASAISQISLRTTSAYSRLREQFKRHIGKFEGIQGPLAKMAGFSYICEATRSFTATAVDAGHRPSIASAISKYHLTEMARQSVNHAMDIHAGRAIQQGPRNYLGTIYDALPTMVTVEGANILTRTLMIFGQGVVRAHPYLRKEIISAAEVNEPKQQRIFDRLLMKHLGYIFQQITRLWVGGITAGRLLTVPNFGGLTQYYRRLSHMSNALAVLTDVTLLLLGGKLKIKELMSARLGDIFSNLYLASAVLKQFHEHGAPEDEHVFVEWSLQYCLLKMQVALNKLVTNYPRRWLGKLLRFVIQPWGMPVRAIDDRLVHRMAAALQSNPALRERLTPYCYVNSNANDATGRIELAFMTLLQTEPLLDKIDGNAPKDACEAGIIDVDELAQIEAMQALRRDAIAVDEFH